MDTYYVTILSLKELQGNNHYGYCEAGFSAEFSADGYDVILGVVGAKRGKGEVICTLCL